jgi:hypothetical protein
MSRPIRQLLTDSGADALRRMDPPGREFQELWFALARQSWRSMVLVPADEGASAAATATSLAEVGRRLREAPVTFFIVADPLDYSSAAHLAASVASTDQAVGAGVAPAGRVIVAIQPVVVEPLGVAVAQAADAAVLCVELGRTRLAAARRTIDLVGRDRIAGCILIG